MSQPPTAPDGGPNAACADFPGAVVKSSDSRYPALVRGFNQRWVGKPRAVRVCGSPEQVEAAVRHGVSEQRRLTVRGGGHCYEDFVSGNDGGVILDLSSMHRVCRQGNRGPFVVEGGATLWNVYSQLFKEYGRTLPGGSCYSVGAGGHVTGGGYGLLSRRHGLVVDTLTAVDVVVVDTEGSVRTVHAAHDAPDPALRELFWAHQGGGGGNFGVVTRFYFADPPKAPSEAWLASIAWEWDTLDLDQFGALVRNYGEYFAAHSAPDDPANGLFALLHLTQKAAGQIVLTAQYVGPDPTVLARFLAAMGRDLVPPVAPRVAVGYHHLAARTTDIQRMPWLDVTQTLNPSGPNRRGKYKSAYMKQPFPEHQIPVLWVYLTESYPNPAALLQVDSYGGQINAVAADATAVPQRSSILKLQYQTYWEHPRDDADNLRWIRDFYNAMYGPRGPWPDATFDGCYVNYPDVDLVDWEYLYYKSLYPRLQQVKARWDPGNVFHHAQARLLPNPGPPRHDHRRRTTTGRTSCDVVPAIDRHPPTRWARCPDVTTPWMDRPAKRTLNN